MKRRIRLGHVAVGEVERNLLADVIAQQRLSYGPKTRELEQRIAALHNVKHAVFMASGTCALQVGLESMKEIHDWPDDGEVIIPATTFIATMSAVIHAGLRPVLCDVEADTFGMDSARIREHVTDKTVAVLPVHLLGRACKLGDIMRVTRGGTGERYIPTAEDCCESVGVGIDVVAGRIMVGEQAAFAAISTYVCHHLSTGVGGAVLTNNDELATICRSLIQHGRDPSYLSLDDDSPETVDAKYRFVRWGHSYRGSELQAALGLAGVKSAHVKCDACRATRSRGLSNGSRCLMHAGYVAFTESHHDQALCTDMPEGRVGRSRAGFGLELICV